MSRAYQSAREHMDDELALIAVLVERQIRAHWELGILPRIKDEFSGTFVGGDEVRALLAGGLVASAEGQRRIAELDASIVARGEQIEARLAASRALGRPLAFDRLRSTFALTATEQRVLWVLIADELSARHRQLCRYLVNDANRAHADVGLLEILVYSSPRTRDLLIRELAPDARLFQQRLVEYVGSRRAVEDSVFLLRPLKVAYRVLELVHGVTRLDREVAPVARLVEQPPGFSGLIVDETVRKEVVELLRPRRGATTPAVVLSGAEGSGRKALALGAAQALGCAALVVRCRDLPTEPNELSRQLRAVVRESVLFRAIPVFDGIDDLAGSVDAGVPDRTKFLEAALDGFFGPVAATCKPLDARPVALGRGIVVVDVPSPTESQRAELWRRALSGRASRLDMDKVAARYPITPGIIARSAEAAIALATARQDPAGVDDADVHAGLRSTLDTKLSVLGRRIMWRQTWDDLVLPEDSSEEVREFLARVRHRRRVYDEWGFSRKMAKGLGLSALFAGPPGTGKTMVAGIIADELSLDLYQIDLSRIVSKYVGETEKNLAQLFDAAEAGHAILLFDEADSLFAKRTEVKSSVDRYANLEVNYLLQRMEAFNGITILTTNLESSIDEAFKRRISFRVNFPFPEPEDRIRLWQAMLPSEAEVASDIDFDMLADRYEMSGGYIRNAVLRAAFLAADEKSPITMQHLLRAATLEYAAMGKVMTSFAH